MKNLLVLLFLASTALAQDPAVASKLQTQACGSVSADFQIKIDRKNHPWPAVDPGKALVYVIEDQKTKYIHDVTIRVGLDGGWVGADRGNSYLFFSVEPGVHHLCADWMISIDPDENLFALANFTAEPGKTYYFRARTLGSVSSAANRYPDETYVLDLDPLSEDQGQFLVASAGHSVWHQDR